MFLQFVAKNLDKNWDWHHLTRNPNITIEDILAHPELPWNMREIQHNPNVALQIVADNLEIRNG